MAHARNAPPVLLSAGEYKAFFCRISDPSFVKFKKLEMLTDVADQSNVESIVEELAAYVTDIDVEIAQRSVRSVGQIACKLPDAREHCISIVRAWMGQGYRGPTGWHCRPERRRRSVCADCLCPPLFFFFSSAPRFPRAAH